MQALIPFLAILGLTSGTHLTLLPYAYLVDPLPVYHQSQNTKTGEHAYSYYGGPSAKEEVKGLDGVTRGSYSYVDAHGILQSVFYVADEGGFRVAATNLPAEEKVSLGISTEFQERNQEGEESTKSRRKRSLEDSPTDESITKGKVAEGAIENKEDQKPAESTNGPIYSVLRSVILPQVPTATSHQSRLDIYKSAHIELPKENESVQIPLVETVPSLSETSTRQFYQRIGLEGIKRKDVIKIQPDPVVILQPYFPQIYESEYSTKPGGTAASNRETVETQGNTKLKIVAPIEPVVYLDNPTAYVQPIGLLPLAQSSQYRSDIIRNIESQGESKETSEQA